MSAPSFLYSGIDKETLSLSDELASLGGGDAQASHLELHAFVNTSLRRNDQQLLWPYDNMIGLRDLTLPQGSPASKSMKYYTVDSVITHEQTPAANPRFSDVALDAAQWVSNGFNSCMVSIGMRNSGKSDALFGQFGVEREEYGISNCLAGNVLEQLFHKKRDAQSQGRSTLTIALSAWFVQLHQITDLVAPVHGASTEPLDFASVECPDLSTACRILHECRTRAPGCLTHDPDAHGSVPYCSERDRGNFFMRVLLHDSPHDSTHGGIGTVSYMYIVDLLGILPVDNNSFQRLPEEEKITARTNNMQVQSLFKVLGEMQALSKAAQTNPLTPAETALTAVPYNEAATKGRRAGPAARALNSTTTAGATIMKMTSARDAKLTTILAPIIQGNVKTSLLLFLQDGASLASESYNLLNAVNGTTDIISACMRVKDISLASLGLLQHEEVLAPYFRTRGAAPSHLSPPGTPRSHRGTTSEVEGSVPTLRTPSADCATDTSTDYGEINLDHILAGDFNSPPRRAARSRGGKSQPALQTQRDAVRGPSPQRGQSTSQPAETRQPHSVRHAHYALAPGQDTGAPHSEDFEAHRRQHYHDEAHRPVPEKHAHYPADPREQRVLAAHDASAPHSAEFLEHRRQQMHEEAHPPRPHAHYAADGSELAAHDARAPHSEEFLQHRRQHYHDEAHPPQRHAHYGADQQQLAAHDATAPHAPDFLQHRRQHYHSEAHPPNPPAHHAHYDDRTPAEILAAHDADAPHSEEFLQHRRQQMHEEAHPPRPHARYAADGSELAAHDANAPHSAEFLQHRRQHYHDEAHRPVPEKHAHYPTDPREQRVLAAHDARAPHSPEFLEHRRQQMHEEAHPPRPHAHYPADPSAQRELAAHDARAPHSEKFLEHRRQHYHHEADHHGDQVRASSASAVEQVLDEFHDLMEEIENSNAQDSARGANTGHAHNMSAMSNETSFGWPRQVVSDFLQNNRAGGGGKDVHQDHAAARSWDGTSGRDRYDAEGDRSPSGGTNALRSSFPAASGGRSPDRGPGATMRGSLLHGGSPGRGHAEDSEYAALETSMMADSLMGGSDVEDAEYSESPAATNARRERSAASAAQYKYRYPSVDTILSDIQPDFAGIGSTTAEPLSLNYRPKLSDTDPVDLDTVNYITSSYSDFFKNSLIEADPLRRSQGEWDGDQASTGSSRPSAQSPTGSRGSRSASAASRARGRAPAAGSPHRSGTSSMRSSFRSDDGDRESYMDRAIPSRLLTLDEALVEIEHLRRTNHSLVEALSDESHRRTQLEDKLCATQDDLLEVRTQCEVMKDTHALEVKQLKAQMRSLCDNQSLTDVFATFEGNVARLVRENEALRQMNLHLEAKELDSLLRVGEMRLSTSGGKGPGAAGQDGEGSETYRLQAAKKENLRLVTRLKKSGQDREALRAEYEELKAKERHFVVNTKIANDCARRLRVTHQDLLRTKKELEEQTAAREAVEKDLRAIREDTQGLRASEAALREERSRYLSELAAMRERVKEVDQESRRVAQLNRFVHKHAAPPAGAGSHGGSSQAPALSSTAASAAGVHRTSREGKVDAHSSNAKPAPLLPFQAYRAHIAAMLENSVPSARATTHSAPHPNLTNPASQPHEEVKEDVVQSHSGHYQGLHSHARTTVGQAGLSDAGYFRPEEADGIEPSLEVSLTAMHESLIATQPTLLPLFRKLTSDIHSERTRALQKRSQLLSLVQPRQYESRDGAEPATNEAHSSSASYANLLKAHQSQQKYSASYEDRVSGANSGKGTKKAVRF